MSEPEPCPCEDKVPDCSPGPVGDEETLVRFIKFASHVHSLGDGTFCLAPAAISQNDLQKKDRSLSSIREGFIGSEELRTRAATFAEEPGWKTDPVLARSSVLSLRSLVDGAGRREICVMSDPTLADDDPFGACPAHASARRSQPPLDPQKRTHWLLLRTQVGECFNWVEHWSGSSFVLDAK